MTYDNKDYIEPLTAESDEFLGDDIIFFPQVDSNKDTVAIGMTRKSGQGDIDGSGTVVKIKFKTSKSIDTSLPTPRPVG